MKKAIVFVILITTSLCVLSAQRKTYGLNNADLDMLMGSYMDGDCSTKTWGEEDFSWGKQITGINNGLIIDYSPYLEVSNSIYKDNLTISIAGFFVVSSIQKINKNQFCLMLIDLEACVIPSDAGKIIITFNDPKHIQIDDSNLKSNALSFSRKDKMLWKTAGPTIIQINGGLGK
jgi:hypothetical protein